MINDLGLAVAAASFGFALHEIYSGKLPGGNINFLWYRWLTTPTRVRIVGGFGLIVSIALVILFNPHSLVDFAALALGLCVPAVVLLKG